MTGKTGIVDSIQPRLEAIQDFYGNTPLHYAIAQNDTNMILKYFKMGSLYFEQRNFKYQSIFHIAGKHNSLLSLKALLGRSVFIEELLKKDFKGDTPLHSAAKSGSIDVLEFFMTACTPQFLEI